MELRHLRYFVAVAEELNFRRAAERLRVAQPAVSAQIKSLEGKLGVRLFERTTRSVLLTPAGRVFLDESRRVLVAASQAEQSAHKAHHGIVGTLRLGVIAPATSPRLANVLRHFHQSFPGVQLALMELTSPNSCGACVPVNWISDCCARQSILPNWNGGLLISCRKSSPRPPVTV